MCEDNFDVDHIDHYHEELVVVVMVVAAAVVEVVDHI
jgi:hypothetical protein